MMLRWFRRPRAERRQSGGYTAAQVAALTMAAAGGDDDYRVAAVEQAVGLVSRAFATATVTPAGLTPPGWLADLARRLLVVGEAVYAIDTGSGGMLLLPAVSHDVYGGAAPESWRYRLTLAAPDDTDDVYLPHAGVVHVRYSSDAARPWVGVGPLQRAGLSAALLGRLEARLGEEAQAASGYMLPAPDALQDEIEAVTAWVLSLRGQTGVATTMMSGWGEGPAQAPAGDYRQVRIGYDAPDGMTRGRDAVATAVAMALGLPPGLLPDADGAAAREGFRQLQMGCLLPLGDLVSAELTDKLETAVRFDFSRLFAADIATRARAFHSLVTAGMPQARAAELAGLS